MQAFHLAAVGLALLTTASGCVSLPQPRSSAETLQPARDAPAWAGTYRGVFPCADCAGIETVVSLHADGTYTSSSRYLGKGSSVSTRSGTFEWDRNGAAISLSGTEPARYKLGDKRLTRLALDGSPITSTHDDLYVLTKLADGIVGKYWRLTELRGQAVPRSEKEPHLILHADGRRVTGYSGCNSFSGGYVLDATASRIDFGQLAMTRKFCSAEMETERELIAALGQSNSYVLDGNRLTLQGAGMVPLARFDAVYLR
jgi:copper homeostasis protein (lipoprotein)